MRPVFSPFVVVSTASLRLDSSSLPVQTATAGPSRHPGSRLRGRAWASGLQCASSSRSAGAACKCRAAAAISAEPHVAVGTEGGRGFRSVCGLLPPRRLS